MALGSPSPSPPAWAHGSFLLRVLHRKPHSPARALHPSLVSQPRVPKKAPRHGAPQPVGRRGPRSAGRGRAHPRPGQKRRRAVSPATTAGRAPGPAEPASRLEASSCLQTPADSEHLILNYLSRFAPTTDISPSLINFDQALSHPSSLLTTEVGSRERVAITPFYRKLRPTRR